ncbi:conserved hypothetical protein [Vibrio chagasii]|uniref:hypothetical protein n=1 Tax=Vibrio coralliirubri TaxID=1516159 RepID=UPI00063468CB|nr:hypothetical protein [Vibrio coralliirubri]CAH7227821.1 conserved hypothetical protein [Vibrio chagasii]CDT48425.1 hypothetical protein VCR29J2_350042 [Vibrio coralliirubri]
MIKLSTCIMTDHLSQSIKETISSVIEQSNEVVILATNLVAYNALSLHYSGSKIKVCFLEWVDNFSHMRNYLSSQCSNDIVFHLDSDERVSSSFFDELFYLLALANTENTVFEVTVVDESGSVARNIPRIFNKTHFCYFGFVHEIVRPNNDALHFSYISLKHSITHRGYSLEQMKTKLIRNTRLNKKNVKEFPTDLRWVYFSIKEDCQIGNYQNALNFLGQVKSNENQDDTYIAGCYCYLLFSLIFSSRLTEAKILLKTATLNQSDNDYFEALTLLYEVEAYKEHIQEIIANITSTHGSSIDTNGFHIDMLRAKLEIMNQNFCEAFALFGSHNSRGRVMSRSLERKLVEALESL